MTSALLSAHFDEVMDNAMIADEIYDFDARDESHAFYLEADFYNEDVIWRGENGYAICTVPDDEQPTVLLFKNEVVVGLYRDMMIWIDPQHRGKGMGTQMVVEFAEHFGEDAFKNDQNDPSEGLGFTNAGFATHQAAKRQAEERLADTAGPSI